VPRPAIDEDRAKRILELESAVKEAASEGDAIGERAALEKWIETDPFDPVAQLRLGNLYATEKDDVAAMRALERAVVCDPALFSAQLNLSRVYLRLGFRTRALSTLDHARRAAPNERARATIAKTAARIRGRATS
jgi:tetratricopeptide (TPR) repeat protein